MLQQQPGAGRQVFWRGGDDAANIVQPVGATHQRLARLVRQRRQVRVVRRDVGRVADDEVKALVRQRAKPVAVAQVQFQPEPRRVARCDGQRVGTGIDGRHARARPLSRQRQRNGAAAGAQIEHAAARIGRQQGQRPVDQRLGVVARVEHAGIDLQLQPIERLAACEIGHRLAGQAARGQLVQACVGGTRQRVVVVRQQPGARVGGLPKDVQQQHLRFRARQAAGLQRRQCVGD